MTSHVLCERYRLAIPHAHSLKAKRASLRPLLESLKTRFNVSVAETDFQDKWQRAEITVAVSASSQRQAIEQMDEVQRFVWARADTETLGSLRVWVEFDE